MTSEFEKLLDEIYRKKLNTNIQFEDWNYMSLMTMFFMWFIFELKLSDNWLSQLFTVHHVNHTNLAYLNSLSNYFTGELDVK